MAAQQPLVRLAALVLLPWAAATLLACAGLAPRHAPASRISELLAAGDPPYQASQRLVIEGLDAETAGQTARARSRYERALQIDASNPWVYVALARHFVEAGEARRALGHLERADALFESLEIESPGAAAHLDGLRGAALAQLGRDAEARPLLDTAARSAPAVWGDGRLEARELR